MSYTRVPNIRCRRCVQAREPFKGHNLEGRWEEREGVRMYVVRSYEWWPLFAYVNGVWFENSDRYSVSTSKQRSQTHPHCDTVSVPHENLVMGLSSPISQALGVYRVLASAS
jgi:hypothetical protein